jgi:small-conductance mechanosensitive channel
LNGDLEEENEEAANGIATPVAPDLPAPDLPAPDLPTNGGEAVALHPPHRRRPSPWGLLRRMPLVLARLLLDLMPILVFVAVGNGLLGTPIGSPYTTRLVILAVVNAYVICRLVMCFTRMLVSPQNHDLRLVHMSDGTATYIAVWVRRLAVIAVFGYAAAEVGLLFGLYPTAHDAVMKLVSLVVHLCLVVIVLEKRQAVATWIRAAPGRRGAMVMVRNRLARVWHHVAIFYIVALWLVWAFEVEHGFARLLRIFVVTVAVLVAGRLVAIMALGALDRSFRIKPDIASRFPGLEARAHRYHPAVRQVINGAVVAATGVALLQAWGLGALGWFTSGELGGRIVSALVTIGIMLLLSLLVWEATNAAFDRHLGHLSKNAQLSRAARMRTLRPLLRTALLVAICMVTGLTILSEIGVNIAPLLAGAGIVGVAIGFGSQKLVQDLITGLFLLMENAMQVGDWVTVASLSGTVEALSIRTIRLRAGDGSVHIIPFSSVTSVNNTNRGLGNAAVSVNISAREDTDHVGEALKQIALEMREDPTFAKNMLSDLQLWGVDKLDSNMVTMVGQIVCTDSGRWGVQREFNRRMKKRFEELGIEIATPTQTIRLHTDRAVPQAKAGGVAEEPGEAATTRTDSPPPAALGHTE